MEKRIEIKHNILISIGLLLLYVGLKTIAYGSHSGNYKEVFVTTSITLPAVILAMSCVIFYLSPRFLFKGKYMIFLLLFLVSSPLFTFIKWGIDYYITYPWFYGKNINWSHFCANTFLRNYVEIFFIVLLEVSIMFGKHWYQKQQENQQLIQKNIEAELSLLKAQLNPHFLFNTLNNLYSLANEKSDKVPSVIEKLSDLLNYVLYECNADEVPLKKEINFIKTYIELEKLRYGNKLKCEINFQGDSQNYNIPPMLLITFVENSFKHGASTVRLNPYVIINIEISEKQLVFTIKNNRQIKMKSPEKEYQSGIGLKNLQKRLQHIYQKKYTLVIKDEPEMFEVTLNIPMHEKI